MTGQRAFAVQKKRVPILFSILGGMLAYVVLKDRDEATTGACLALGMIVILAQFFTDIFQMSCVDH